jgi:hypothetical protein
MYDWEKDTREWIDGQHWLDSVPPDQIVAFFRNAFEYAQHPAGAWFGTHQQVASLVSGGIFLAAFTNTPDDKGVWLLTDDPQVAIIGLHIKPVRSTATDERPLTWTHLWPLDALDEVLQSADLWESYAAASARIRHFPIGRGRDDLLRARGKRPLTEFWMRCEQIAAAYPDEADVDATFPEGAIRTVIVNAYERDPAARRLCISHFGAVCSACGMDFERVYGPLGRGLIHVHHLQPLHTIRVECHVNPLTDLRPVCPNCHAMIHRRSPPFEIDEIRAMLVRQVISRD